MTNHISNTIISSFEIVAVELAVPKNFVFFLLLVLFTYVNMTEFLFWKATMIRKLSPKLKVLKFCDWKY